MERVGTTEECEGDGGWQGAHGMPTHSVCLLMCHSSTLRLQGQPVLSLFPNHSCVGAGPGLRLQVYFFSLRPLKEAETLPHPPPFLSPLGLKAERKKSEVPKRSEQQRVQLLDTWCFLGGLAKRNKALTSGHVALPPASTSPGPASL